MADGFQRFYTSGMSTIEGLMPKSRDQKNCVYFPRRIITNRITTKNVKIEIAE